MEEALKATPAKAPPSLHSADGRQAAAQIRSTKPFVALARGVPTGTVRRRSRCAGFSRFFFYSSSR